MAYAFVFDIPGPLELYQAAHAEFAQHPADGLILHLARHIGDGVEVVELWASEEAFRDWMSTYGVAALGAVAAAGWTLPEITPTPFEPVGLVMPAAGLVV